MRPGEMHDALVSAGRACSNAGEIAEQDEDRAYGYNWDPTRGSVWS